MADFISGFIGKAIDLAVDEMLRHIKIAVRCRKELASLEKLVKRIQPITTDIQRYRAALNFGEVKGSDNAPAAVPASVNKWLKILDELLENARDTVEQCTIPTCNVIARYQLSKKITTVIAGIEEHLKDACLIAITNQFGRLNERIAATTSSSTRPVLAHRQQPVHEPLILGQDEVLSRAERMLIDEQQGSPCRIGAVGMGGSGKTLLLKRLYNSDAVQRHFGEGLTLWLTVSQSPSIETLLKELGKGISDSFDQNWTQDDARRWCHDKLTQRRFVIFLDDVWEGSEGLLENLGVPVPETCNNSKIVVSSREKRVLAGMRIADNNIIAMNFLLDSQSWELFRFHAFPGNPHNPPVDVDRIARPVCSECGGLPLAVKVIGAAMSGIRDPREWELTLQRLRNAGKINNRQVQNKLYGRLRLSYDALGLDDPSLQLCFVYLGAFKDDQSMVVEDVIKLWIGDGLLATKNDDDDYDPFLIGRTHVNVLLDRCLIEARSDDGEGQVEKFSMHDVLHDLARQIAEDEENCFFRAGRDLNVFPANDCFGTRDCRSSLMGNKLSSVPDTFRGPHVRALLLSGNKDLVYVSPKAMGSLISIRVLDLSGCESLRSLPETLGRMKRLVCLRLSETRIQRLPESITRLTKLQVLDLQLCLRLRELPSGMNTLTSLRYLDIAGCLLSWTMPSEISSLTSLQYLRVRDTPAITRMLEDERRSLPTKGRGPLEDREARLLKKRLHGLTNLKHLEFSYYGETIIEGTLESMLQMRTLYMRLCNAKTLPDHMIAASQLRSLQLRCPKLVTIPRWVCEFVELDHLSLFGCDDLEELPELQKLGSLRRLKIHSCRNLKKLPSEFGEVGAFPALQSLSLAQLSPEFTELPTLEKGAMPSLENLEVWGFRNLKELPEGVYILENLKELRIVYCALLKQKMEGGGEHWERVRILREKNVKVAINAFPASPFAGFPKS